MKDPKCTICGGPHYKTFCFNAPKKPIAVRAVLRPSATTIIRKRYIEPSAPKKRLKRYKIAPVGKSERAKLIREADRVFSIYIRRKDAINGIARCVTCGAAGHWKVMHNGHYLSRRIIATRWNQINCNVQCERCNIELSGNIAKYREYLQQKHGEGVTAYLQEKMRTKGKTTNAEIQDIIDTYTNRIAEFN
jgi:NinG protein